MLNDGQMSLAQRIKGIKAITDEGDDTENLRDCKDMLLYLLSEDGRAEFKKDHLPERPEKRTPSLMNLAVSKGSHLVDALACTCQFLSLSEVENDSSNPKIFKPYLCRGFGNMWSCPVQNAGYFAGTQSVLALGLLGGTALEENAGGDAARGDIQISEMISNSYQRSLIIKVVEIIGEREVRLQSRKGSSKFVNHRETGASVTRRVAVIKDADPIFECPDGWTPRHFQRMVHAIFMLGTETATVTKRRMQLLDGVVEALPDNVQLKAFIDRIRPESVMKSPFVDLGFSIPDIGLELTAEDLAQHDGDGWLPAHWLVYMLMHLYTEDLTLIQKKKQPKNGGIALMAEFLQKNKTSLDSVPERFSKILQLPVDAYACDPQNLVGNWIWQPPSRGQAAPELTRYAIQVKEAYCTSSTWKRTTGSKFEYKGIARRSFHLLRVYFLLGEENKKNNMLEDDGIVRASCDCDKTETTVLSIAKAVNVGCLLDLDKLDGDAEVLEKKKASMKGAMKARILSVLDDWVEIEVLDLDAKSTMLMLVRPHRLTLQPAQFKAKEGKIEEISEVLTRKPLTVELLRANADILDVNIVIRKNWAPDGASNAAEKSVMTNASMGNASFKESPSGIIEDIDESSMGVRFLRNNVLISQLDAETVEYNSWDVPLRHCGKEQQLAQEEWTAPFKDASDSVVGLHVKSIDGRRLKWATGQSNDDQDAVFYRIEDHRRTRFFHWLLQLGEPTTATTVVKALVESKLEKEKIQQLLSMRSAGFNTPFTCALVSQAAASAQSYKVFLEALCAHDGSYRQLLRKMVEDQLRLPVRYRSFLHTFHARHVKQDGFQRLEELQTILGCSEAPLSPNPMIVLLASAAASNDLTFIREVMKNIGEGDGSVKADTHVIPGVFPLGEATRRGHIEAMELLMSKGGAKADAHSGLALWLAITHQKFTAAEFLLNSDVPDLTNFVAFSTSHPHASRKKKPVPFDIPPMEELLFFNKKRLFSRGYSAFVLQEYNCWRRDGDPSTVATLTVLLDSEDTDYSVLLDGDSELFRSCHQFPMCKRAGELFASLISLHCTLPKKKKDKLKKEFSIGDVAVAASDTSSGVLQYPFHFLFEKAVSPRPIESPFWLTKPLQNNPIVSDDMKKKTVTDHIRGYLQFKLRYCEPSLKTKEQWIKCAGKENPIGREAIAEAHEADDSLWILSETHPTTTLTLYNADGDQHARFTTSSFGKITLDRSTSAAALGDLPHYFCFLYPTDEGKPAAKKPDSAVRRAVSQQEARRLSNEDALAKIGGYAYFDDKLQLVNFQAFDVAKSSREAHLQFIGPFPLRSTAIMMLKDRWHDISMQEMQDVGARRFLWLSPNEHEHLRTECAIPHGGFAYEMWDPVNKVSQFAYFMLQLKDCAPFGKVQLAHINLASALADYLNKLKTTEFPTPQNLQSQFNFQQDAPTKYPQRPPKPGEKAPAEVFVANLFPRLSSWGLAFSTPLQLAIRMHQIPVLEAMICGENKGIATKHKSAEVREELKFQVDEATRRLINSITYMANNDVWRDTEDPAMKDYEPLREAIRLLGRPAYDFTYLPTTLRRSESIYDFFLEELPVEHDGRTKYEDHPKGACLTFNGKRVRLGPREFVFHGTPGPTWVNPIVNDAEIVIYIPPHIGERKKQVNGQPQLNVDDEFGFDNKTAEQKNMRNEIGGESEEDETAGDPHRPAQHEDGEVLAVTYAELPATSEDTLFDRKGFPVSNEDFPLGGFLVVNEFKEIMGIKRLTTDRRLRNWSSKGSDRMEATHHGPVSSDEVEGRQLREGVLQGTTLRLAGPYPLFHIRSCVKWRAIRPRARDDDLGPWVMHEDLDFSPMASVEHVRHVPPFCDYDEIAWIPSGSHLHTTTPIPACPFGGVALKSYNRVDMFVIAERPTTCDPWQLQRDHLLHKERKQVVEMLIQASLHPQETSSADERLWELTELTQYYDRFGIFTDNNHNLDATTFCLLLQHRLLNDMILKHSLLHKCPYRFRGYRIQELLDESPENRVMLFLPKDIIRTSGYRHEVIEDHRLSLLHWAATLDNEDFFRSLCDPKEFAWDIWNDRVEQRMLSFTSLQFLLPTHYAAYAGAASCMKMLLYPPPDVYFQYPLFVDGAAVSDGSSSNISQQRIRYQMKLMKKKTMTSMELNMSRRQSMMDSRDRNDASLSSTNVERVNRGETHDELKVGTELQSDGEDESPHLDTPVKDSRSVMMDAMTTVEAEVAEQYNHIKKPRMSPLALAALFSHVDVVDVLLQRKANGTEPFDVKVSYSSANNSSDPNPFEAHRPSIAQTDAYGIAAARLQVSTELHNLVPMFEAPTKEREIVELMEKTSSVKKVLNKMALRSFFWDTLHPFVIVILGSAYFALLFADSSGKDKRLSAPYWARKGAQQYADGIGDLATTSDMSGWWDGFRALVDNPPSSDIMVVGAVMFGVLEGVVSEQCDWSLDAVRSCVHNLKYQNYNDDRYDPERWNHTKWYYTTIQSLNDYSTNQFRWTTIPTLGNVSAIGDFSLKELVPSTARAVLVAANYLMPAADRLVTHAIMFEVTGSGALLASDTMYPLRPTFFPSNPGPQDRGRQFFEILILMQLVILFVQFAMNMWKYVLVAKKPADQHFIVHIASAFVKQLFDQLWTVTLIVNLALSVTFNGVLRTASTDMEDDIVKALSDPSVYVDSFFVGTALRYVRTAGAFALFITSFGITNGLRFIPRFGPPASAILRTVINIEVLIFFLLYLFYIVAITLVGFTLFADSLDGYRSFYPAFMTSFLLSAGIAEEPQFEATQQFNIWAAPIFFLIIIVFIQLMFLNILIAVIGEEYKRMYEKSISWWFDTIREQRRKSQAADHGWPKDRTSPWRRFKSWFFSLFATLKKANYKYFRSYVTANAEPYTQELEYTIRDGQGKEFFETY